MYGHYFYRRQNNQVYILSNNFIIHILNSFKYYKFLIFYLLIKLDIRCSSHYQDYVRCSRILLIPNQRPMNFLLSIMFLYIRLIKLYDLDKCYLYYKKAFYQNLILVHKFSNLLNKHKCLKAI